MKIDAVSTVEDVVIRDIGSALSFLAIRKITIEIP